MPLADQWFLLLVLSAFTIFGGVLAYASQARR